MAKRELEHLGGGRFDVYKEKEKSPMGGVVAVIVFFVILAIIF
jgi:hypothetical protein